MYKENHKKRKNFYNDFDHKHMIDTLGVLTNGKDKCLDIKIDNRWPSNFMLMKEESELIQ